MVLNVVPYVSLRIAFTECFSRITRNAPSWRPACQQLTQHKWQDAACIKLIELDWCIDTHRAWNVRLVPSFRVATTLYTAASLSNGISNVSSPVRPSSCQPFGKTRGSTPIPTRSIANPFKAGCHDGPDTKQHCSLGCPVTRTTSAILCTSKYYERHSAFPVFHGRVMTAICSPSVQSGHTTLCSGASRLRIRILANATRHHAIIPATCTVTIKLFRWHAVFNKVATCWTVLAMAPAGEIWSVVTLSPSARSTWAPVTLAGGVASLVVQQETVAPECTCWCPANRRVRPLMSARHSIVHRVPHVSISTLEPLRHNCRSTVCRTSS